MSVLQETGGWSYKIMPNVADLKTRSTMDSNNFGMLDLKYVGRGVERRGGENSLRRMGSSPHKTDGFVGICHTIPTTNCENAMARQQFTQ